MSFNPSEMWHSMGFLARLVVLILVVMSIYSVWVVIDRAIVFVRAKRQSLILVEALRQALADERPEQTIALINGSSQLFQLAPLSPIARVLHAALEEYRRGVRRHIDQRGDYDLIDAVHRSSNRVKEREIARLKKGLGGLASISSAAPFVGLFGTVVGIINAFRSMATSGQGGLGAVSGGIAEALVTTAVGLMVAIPAVMLFNYFTNIVEGIAVDMNDVSAEVISHVIREGVV